MDAQTETKGPAAKPVGRYRYVVLAVIWITFFFGGFDRAAFPLFLVDRNFLRDMSLEGSPERQGMLMTLLLLPYALSNIFLGHTADRWGPGTRVPAVIISPYARKGFIDHTSYDTTSILRFIERRWGIEPLGTRDASVQDLTNAFDFGPGR